MALRRAIVTGGSAGIGAEVCRQLLATGYEVISLARRSGDIRDPQFSAIEVDLSDAAATRQVVFELARERPATTLVHNAGAVRERPLEQVTPEDLDALVGLHLAAPIALLQANLARDAAGALRPRRARVDPRGAGPARSAPFTPRPRQGSWASRAPGRSSSERRGSPSTSWRPGRSARPRSSST